MRLTIRHGLLILLALAVPIMLFVFPRWHAATERGGQVYAEPFRIAGNLYYVGASDVTAFLITGPEGHILIDGGYPGTPPLIMASIAQLGFNIKDVKVLLNSEPHYDHAGGLAELQKASGAQLWTSEASGDVIASGGHDENATFWPMQMTVWIGLSRYTAARVDHRFKDGDTIRLGPIALTAHLTGGHARGCTTWSFIVHDHNRDLHVVSACSMALLPGMKFTEPERYPGIKEDFERTFRVLRSLPVDIWVTSHAREFGRWRKFSQRAQAANPVDPFIDPTGYHQYIDDGEARFREVLAKQEQRASSRFGSLLPTWW